MVNEENITTEQEEKAFNEEQEVQETEEKSDDLSFVELYEQSLQEVPTGQIVTGRVVQVNDDVPSGTSISNSITASYSLLSGDTTRPYTETSNTSTSTVQDYPGVLLSPDRSG